MPKSAARGGPLDWDLLFTFTLTLGVILLSGGTAWLLALGRVRRTAAAAAPPAAGGEWLLVPGKRLIAERPDGDFQARLRRAARLAAHPPRRPILILGGRTGTARITEAAAGEAFLRTLPHGERLRVHQEAASQDTLTNLRNVRALLGHWAPGAPVTLVSNRYHLARIGLIADSLGLAHRLCPAEPALARDWTTRRQLLRESFFYLWFIVGKGWATLIRSRRMLARVT